MILCIDSVPCNFTTPVIWCLAARSSPCHRKLSTWGVSITVRTYALALFNTTLTLQYVSQRTSYAIILTLLLMLRLSCKENISSWIVGVAFLQNYYVVFDAGQYQVGFAELASDN
jgi:hypothetical protein